MAKPLRLGFGIRSWSRPRTSFCRATCTTRGARHMFPLPLVAELTPRRHLSVHEHYSLEMLSNYGIAVPQGELAYTPDQAKHIAVKLGGEAVIKAQVLAGGRGKGYFDSGLEGGVILAKSPDEIYRLAGQMLGYRLITKQTGSNGRPCKKVLVCERMKLDGEYYFAIVLDRAFMGPVMVASPYGGVNIEEVAKTSPSYIYKDAVDITTGMHREQAVNMAVKIGFSPECIDELFNRRYMSDRPINSTPSIAICITLS